MNCLCSPKKITINLVVLYLELFHHFVVGVFKWFSVYFSLKVCESLQKKDHRSTRIFSQRILELYQYQLCLPRRWLSK